MRTRILLTGATGYVGGRLLRRLEGGDRPIRCLARRPEAVRTTRHTTEVVRGDCLDPSTLDEACADVDTAYYLVHSLDAGGRFEHLDLEAARNFASAAARAGVRRIVYLGGIADDHDALSSHLRSRADTGAALRSSGVPVVEFRASIVIGAGSRSFQIIQALVERLPVMICPRWVDTPAQPIAVDDVVAYLAAALDLPHGESRVFDIGGPDVVSYGGLMREYARQCGLRRLLIPVPVLTPHLSGLWLTLVTPTQARVGRALVEGLRNPTVVRSDDARRTFAVVPTPLDRAVAQAIDEGFAQRVKRDFRVVDVQASPAETFAPIRRIGGRNGWYFGTALWRVRGVLDRMLGGVGMARGRRDQEHCAEGDALDWWTVERVEQDRLLRLSADLKLPGRGWLEFQVEPLDQGRCRIHQTATFDPRGILGRLYWYALLPIHAVLFRGLIRAIASRAEAGTRRDVDVFLHRSIIKAPASRVFAWHEQPEALSALLPPFGVRLEQQSGGVRDGATATLRLGVGPLAIRWRARHYGYVPGRRFCDEQVSGPFRVWRHTHTVEAISAGACVYDDRVEYALLGGRLVRALTRPLVRLQLATMFRQRHAAVRRHLESPSAARQSPAPAPHDHPTQLAH